MSVSPNRHAFHLAPQAVLDSRRLLQAVAEGLRAAPGIAGGSEGSGDSWGGAAHINSGCASGGGFHGGGGSEGGRPDGGAGSERGGSESERRAGPSPAPGEPPFALPRWPQECPSIEQSVRDFVPTALCLSTPARPLAIDRSSDHASPSRFVTSFFAVESVRTRPQGRVRRIASICYLAPPAEASESDARAELMASHSRGVPLLPRYGWRPYMLTDKLEPPERLLSRSLSMDEQIALVALLAARHGVMAALSPGGDWPRHPLLAAIADRLGCRIVRFGFAGIPPGVLRRFRHTRYES